MYEATRHLCLNGYRQVGFLGQALRFSYGTERLEGYKRALRASGREFDPLLTSIPEEPRDDPTDEEVRAFLARRPLLDAVLTDRGQSVLNSIRAAGRRVPEDIAVISLDEDENSQFFDPPLTALRAPKFELGRAAANMVLRLIAGESPESAKMTLPMELILRDSCPRRG
jgi:LacI family transcriptional regulator